MPAPLVVAFWAGLGGLAVAAGGLSARAFDRPDRLRREAARPAGRVPGAAALLWLTGRQVGRFLLVTALLGLVGGLVVFASPVLAWPVVSLVLGVVCGVRAFAGDENGRLLVAEPRVPATGFWLARVAASCAAAGVACLLALAPRVALQIPALVGLMSPTGEELPLLLRLFGDGRLSQVSTAEAFLPVWALNGLAAGLVCGLLLRRVAIAVPVAVLVAAGASAVWVPSLVGGGLHGWQVVGFLAGMLVASRLLLRPWATGNTLTRRCLAGLGAGLAVAALWDVGGLWYRVAKVPELPDTLDMPGFVSELARPGPEEAGRRCRAALEAMTRRNTILGNRATRPLFRPRGDPRGPFLFSRQLFEVLQRGWPGGEPELAGWLVRMFADPWHVELARATRDGPALILDARQLSRS
jgi:hypothetical protein